MRTWIIAIVTMLVSAPLAQGQYLADKVPGDAIVYVGWAGADALRSGVKGTHLQGILDHSDLPAFVSDFLPQVLNKIGVLVPGAGEPLAMAQQAAGPIWHHPTAFFWAGLTKDQMPRAALLCQAGADADQLVKLLTPLMTQAPMPVQVGRDGDLVIASVGYDKPTDALAAAHGRALAGASKFKSALDLKSDPAVTVYVDTQQAIAAIPTSNDEDKKEKDQFMSMWGLDGVQALSFEAGFDGKNWTGRLFVNAPAPRKGIFSFFDEPLDDAALKVVPVSATSVFAGTFDARKMYDLIENTAETFGPREDFDHSVQRMNRLIGMDLHNDLLAPLGRDWVVFSDPQIAGTGPAGMVLTNRPSNADKLDDSLVKLEQVAVAAIAHSMHEPKIHIVFKEKTINGLTLHYLATPLVTPTWAIKDGVLYVGLYPSVVYSAAQENAGGKSILDNPRFTALHNQLHPGATSAITFLDLPALAPGAYPGILALSRVPGAADIIGVDSPVMLLPKYKDLAAELEPAGMALWADTHGIHLHSDEPFPGSGALSLDASSFTSIQSQATMTSLLLPALRRARESARGVQSANNVRQILMGSMMYASDNQGKLPDSLGQLLAYGEGAAVFINPRAPRPVPAGLTKEQLAKWVDDNSDYVWLGMGKKLSDTKADEVILYERPMGTRIPIALGFADGHVESMSVYAAKQKIPELPIGNGPDTRPAITQPPMVPERNDGGL